jgi:hypothetical protein
VYPAAKTAYLDVFDLISGQHWSGSGASPFSDDQIDYTSGYTEIELATTSGATDFGYSSFHDVLVYGHFIPDSLVASFADPATRWALYRQPASRIYFDTALQQLGEPLNLWVGTELVRQAF